MLVTDLQHNLASTKASLMSHSCQEIMDMQLGGQEAMHVTIQHVLSALNMPHLCCVCEGAPTPPHEHTHCPPPHTVQSITDDDKEARARNGELLHMNKGAACSCLFSQWSMSNSLSYAYAAFHAGNVRADCVPHQGLPNHYDGVQHRLYLSARHASKVSMRSWQVSRD